MDNKEKVKEVRRMLAEMHDKWQNDPEEDGHCKSNEGYVEVVEVYPNWFDAESDKERYINADPEIAIRVYSYLFGPIRTHDFNTIDEGYEAVKEWHTNYMQNA